MAEPIDVTSSAAALSSSSSPALLSPSALAVAATIVERTAMAERRRQQWWWMSLAVQAVVGFLLANQVPPNLEALWGLGIVFVVNMGFHAATGLVTRVRLTLDAQREVLDLAALLEAVGAVRRDGRTVEQAVEQVDERRRLRAR